MSNGMGGHERAHEGATNEWLTPQWLVNALGEFDLDPCSPIHRPFPTARNHFTKLDDGLAKIWQGRVFLNPPYGPYVQFWLRKLSEHGNGIALVFARTETDSFHEYGWDKADAMFFFRGRLHFCTPDGCETRNNAGAPSVLIAYGQDNANKLQALTLPGKFVCLQNS